MAGTPKSADELWKRYQKTLRQAALVVPNDRLDGYYPSEAYKHYKEAGDKAYAAWNTQMLIEKFSKQGETLRKLNTLPGDQDEFNFTSQ